MVVAIADGWPRGVDPIHSHAGAWHEGHPRGTPPLATVSPSVAFLLPFRIYTDT